MKIRSACVIISTLGLFSAAPALAGGHGGHGGGGGHHGGHGGGGHHHHSSVGIYYGIGGFYPGYGWGGYGPGLGYGYGWGGYGFGSGYGYPGYGFGYGAPYYSPYYGYPPVVTVPVTPPVYIQRQEVSPQVSSPPKQPANYWYYCRNPDGYYPYVKNCAEGWMQVAPQPPGQ